MTIQLTPEDEKLIRKRLQSGTFRSIEEVIHEALSAQDSEAEWLTDQREFIDAKIARGITQLDRGEGIAGEAVRERLQQRKAAWQGKQAG